MGRVLVVDDAVFMRTMVKEILQQNGHVVLGEASNGREAIEKYLELQPDIVVMDITMPDVNGIEALKEIKKINSNAKIIMCSAMGQQNMVVESIRAGALDFIVKPFQQERVIEAIRKSGIK